MALTRIYHVVEDGKGITSISLYMKLTDAEVLDGREDMYEEFASEEWNDRLTHRLMSEDELADLKRRIENALKEV